MAESRTALAMNGFISLPIIRQVVLVVVLTAIIVLSIWFCLWLQKPTYRVLYGHLEARDSAQVVEALQKADIPFNLEQISGAIMIPADKVHEARLKLAAEGLPRGAGIGFEFLEKKQGLGVSQFIETARYQRALEGELARTVSSLKDVRSVRIHLAVPKQSAFIRNRKKPSASVLVDLYNGRNLEAGQVAAILHLVAASIPNMDPERVAIIDQKGRLLTSGDESREAGLNANRFEYTRRLEKSFERRIEDILTPVVGLDGMRARVTAEVDFTEVEQTREQYSPEGQSSVRSQQSIKETKQGTGPLGVPGALSNQPPGETIAPEIAANGEKEVPALPQTSRQSVTTNYEPSKTINHTRFANGVIKKLSVAVVVDHRKTVNDTGEVVSSPLTEKEKDRITSLVKEAVGFSSQRGDTINIINEAFAVPPAPEPLPEPPIWKQSWVLNLAKQVLAGLMVLLIIGMVIRPILRNLAELGAARAQSAELPVEEPIPVNSEEQTHVLATTGSKYEDKLSAAKSIASEDPGRVAQVVKNWVGSDAE